MSKGFALIVLVVSLAALSAFVWLGRMLRRSTNDLSVASTLAWIQYVQLVGASLATLVALVGAYFTFFTPFAPQITLGAYTWRIRPEGSPNPPVEVVLWLSAENEGIRPGSIQDLVAVLSLPKGDWLLTPMFLVDSQAYLKAVSHRQDSPDLPITEPFSPIPLPGRAQTSRAVLFMPFEGKADRRLIEPGTHTISFYVRYGDGRVSRLAQRKVVFETDIVEQWRKGTTIAGTQFEGDRPAEQVLKEFGVNVRLR